MRLATITNWAYGATVFLTTVSGITMLMASNVQEHERSAVAQRYRLDQVTTSLAAELSMLSDQAREYVVTGLPSHLAAFQRDVTALRSIEQRIKKLKDAGANKDELDSVAAALRWADTLLEEQQRAIAAYGRGDVEQAREIVFGAEYRLGLDRAMAMIERFQYRLDQRTESEVIAASNLARVWKTSSEVVLGITGLLFLCVLYFVFKRRVLHPVVKLSDVVGRLAAQDYEVETPDYDQIDEIGDMAQAIRVFRENGIERQRLEQERAADQNLRGLLSRMTQRMQGYDAMVDFERVIEHFVPLIAPDFAGRLYLLDKSRNTMVEKCSWLSPVHSNPEFSPMSCWALQRSNLHRPGGHQLDVPCKHLDAGQTTDTICVPLIAQRVTLGLLYLEKSDSGDGLGISDTYLQLLAENIGLALGNLCLRDALRDLAMTDALTGLANRRELENALVVCSDDARRLRQPLACVMIDVDHFKRFNDDFGHAAGDAVLRGVGEILRNSVRDAGLAFRYGGEEFLLLIPGLTEALAIERAEDIRARIQGLRIDHEGRALGSITASAGIACAPVHCDFDELVRTADAALLRAKLEGRDTIVVAKSRRNERLPA